MFVDAARELHRFGVTLEWTPHQTAAGRLYLVTRDGGFFPPAYMSTEAIKDLALTYLGLEQELVY